MYILVHVCVCVYIHVCATYLSCKESNHVTALSSSESLGELNLLLFFPSSCCRCRFRFFVLLLYCCCVYSPPLHGLFCRCYISIFCILYVSFPSSSCFRYIHLAHLPHTPIASRRVLRFYSYSCFILLLLSVIIQFAVAVQFYWTKYTHKY